MKSFDVGDKLKACGLHEGHVDKMISAIYAAFGVNHYDSIDQTKVSEPALAALRNYSYTVRTSVSVPEASIVGVCQRMSINSKPWLSMRVGSIEVRRSNCENDFIVSGVGVDLDWETQTEEVSYERSEIHSRRGEPIPGGQNVFGSGQAPDRGGAI